MIAKLFKGMRSVPVRAQQPQHAYRDLIRREAQLGGQLFGPVPFGHRREFFCLDEHTWIWHEEWVDEKGVTRTRTTRYDVRPDGILKAQDGQGYQQVSREEAANLAEAARQYQQQIYQLYSSGYNG